ncbi:hypothetical protein AtDm6_1683 [Acetobacter tropicalis]|uniref:Uncharacterized protein n=1 Tax=Acetobacter tropicalis TaxID=104102 RepID=A0A095B2V5_9PROT|nr:hypothetical protein AtDm6_1683 [Acetobacter tropicalis]
MTPAQWRGCFCCVSNHHPKPDLYAHTLCRVPVSGRPDIGDQAECARIRAKDGFVA